MSHELPEALPLVLDHGWSVGELDAAPPARTDTDAQIATAWLFAWAYESIRPRRDNLAARITTAYAPHHPSARRGTNDALVHPFVRDSKLSGRPGGRRSLPRRGPVRRVVGRPAIATWDARLSPPRRRTRSARRDRVPRPQSSPGRPLVQVWNGAVLVRFDDQTSARQAMPGVDDGEVVVLHIGA